MNARAIMAKKRDNFLLTNEQWTHLDDVVERSCKYRMPVANMLLKHGLRYDIDNLETTTLQSVESTRSEEGTAITHLPLPLIWKEFELTPIMARSMDWVTAEAAARRVGEQVDKLILGLVDNYYGIFNHPRKQTYILPEQLSDNQLKACILRMQEMCKEFRYYGPYFIVAGTSFEVSKSIFQETEGILDVAISEYIPKTSIALVQATTDVIRLVVSGLPKACHWEGNKFQIIAGIVPQLRTDFYNNMGIVVKN